MFFPSFGLMGIIVPLFFLLVFGMILFALIQGIRQWNKNNHSPRLRVPATVVSRRLDVRRSHHHHGADAHHLGHTSTSTHYYVTFEVESGDRMEFAMTGSEYGMLVEGDRGMLEFQGTRYLGFLRG